MLFYLIILWAGFQVPQSFPDSVKNLISNAKSDSAKGAFYNDLARHYYGYEQDTAIFYARQSIEIAENLGLQKLEGSSYNVMGVAYLIGSEYEEAIKSHFKALKIREELLDSAGMLESNLNIGNVYYRNGEMAKAAGMYEKALVIGLATKNLRGQSLIYNNLGNYYKDKWSVNNSKEDYDKAMGYLLESLRIKEELNDNHAIVKTLSQLSRMTTDDQEKSKAYLMRALKITENSPDIENKLSVLNQLSNYHLREQKYSLVKQYALQAYELAKETNAQFYISVSAEYLIDASLGENDYKAAYEYLTIKNDADKSLFNDSRQKIREELLIEFETERKELENQKLIQQQERLDLSIEKRNQMLATTTFLILVMGVLYWLRKRSHQKLKKAHDQLEEIHNLATSQNAKIQEQADRLNQANLELTKANKFRDKIFSVISHDLRAPFSSLHSVIQLWDEKVLSENELSEVMPLIAKESNALYLMLNNLLTWAKSQIGSEEVQLSTFGLGELVEENTRILSTQLTQKNQQLNHEVQPDIMVTSDRERLSFIVRNILMNAVKFTPANGSITIDYPSPEEIRIRDSGQGMSAATLSRLFTDRVHSQKGTEGESGTGIGLMLCKEFAESIGAEILVESQLGQGTTFRILLDGETLETTPSARQHAEK